MPFPKPIMFEKPIIYIDSIIIGIAFGLAHFLIFTNTIENNFVSLYSLALFSFFGALICGSILGILNQNTLGKYLLENNTKNFLTLLGTKSAIISAVTITVMFYMSYHTYQTIPPFTIVLPMWLVVLWMSNFISGSVIIYSVKEKVKQKNTKENDLLYETKN